MNVTSKILLGIFLGMLSMSCLSNEWVRDVKVTQIGAYHHSSGHFVWLSQSINECLQVKPNNPILHFSEDNPGGKSLFSVLVASVVSKATVDVQVNGCDIVEVYLKSN